MNGLVLTIFYGSIIFCVAVLLIKLYYYSRLPLPLRSDIYKGSSVFEHSGGFLRNGIGLKAKLKASSQEVLLLDGYRRQSRKFWLFLYPFHLGISMLILWHFWLFVFPLAGSAGLNFPLIWGHTAAGLIFVGALGVLIMRLADKKLRATYPRSSYLKWIFIVLALGSGIFAVQFYFHGSLVEVIAYVKQQLAFGMQEKLNPTLIPSLHVLTVAAVLIYLPFSHAWRVLFRYYYKLRWESVPNIAGGRVDQASRRQLSYPIAWSAKHMPVTKTWTDL